MLRNVLCLTLVLTAASQTVAPTDSPTDIPTASPTTPPTGPPTNIPTASPTTAPTGPPTESPLSNTPTLTPSAFPSFFQTSPPTEFPSPVPTDLTDIPTFIPTNQPSIAPSSNSSIDEYSLEVSQFYSVNAGSAYTWDSAFPQSCECIENDVLDSKCTLFKCLCSCDINAGLCDYNCCCDPDCSDNQISRFKELGKCEYEGHSASTVEHCYSSVELYGVNPREPMGGQPTAQEALGQALCVVETNYALKGNYYQPSALLSSDIFDQSTAQKDYSYVEADTAIAADSNYDQNDTISAFLLTVTNGLVSNGPGFLQVPVADMMGVCNDNNFAAFENSEGSSSCERQLSTAYAVFESQCTSAQSVARYASSLWVAKAADTLASDGFATLSDVVNVQLQLVAYEDFTTGITQNITAAWREGDCNTTAIAGGDYHSSSACAFASAQFLALYGSQGVCQNFVKSVSYEVQHDTLTSATITAVLATVVVTDVPVSAGTVKQTFGISYSSADSSSVSADNGNIVKRTRSGNPGYMVGLPVLYGVGADTYVHEYIAGFTVPVAKSPGTCPSATDGAGAATVNFGFDVSTGCVLPLNRQELIDLCCQGQTSCTSLPTNVSPYARSDGVPYYLNISADYVGIYGDADPLDISQWFAITYQAPAATRTWNDKTSTCSDFPTALNIQFLVSLSGEKSNPQNKIVAALAQLETSDVVLRVPSFDANTTQNTPLSITVSFVNKKDNSVQSYEPPAPPVLFHVPYDVFYPFVTGTANSAPSLRSSRRLTSIADLFSSAMSNTVQICICLVVTLTVWGRL